MVTEQNSKEFITESISWYTNNIETYTKLSIKVVSLITEILQDHKIPIHAIYSRTKELKSFEKKIGNPRYSDPKTQITDLSGIRIITYVESDLDKIEKLIEKHFELDLLNCIDKSQSLGTDMVGYRSIHYIAKLPVERVRLPENMKFKDIYFEIQLRTILQHAWAEVEHDKNYKFAGVLPKSLKRRFKVLAGVLELADREFNEIAKEIDEYSLVVEADTKSGKLDIPIDSTSIKSYLSLKFQDIVVLGLSNDFHNESYEKNVFSEMKLFGISNLKQLDDIIPNDFPQRMIEYKCVKPNNFSGLLRLLMVINNAEKYFEFCWQSHFMALNKTSFALVNSYNPEIEKILRTHKVRINST